MLAKNKHYLPQFYSVIMKHIPEAHLTRFVLFCFNYCETSYNKYATGILTIFCCPLIKASL